MRRGLLDPDKLKGPDEKRDETPNIGGHHRPPVGKHEFKFSKKYLLSEYALVLKGYYAPLFVLLAVTITSALVAAVAPYVLKLLIDYPLARPPVALPFPAWIAHSRIAAWLPGAGYASLKFLAMVLIVAALIGVQLEWVRLLAAQRLNFRLAGTLRQRLHDHMAQLSLSKISDYKTGGIVSRIMGDVEGIVGLMQNGIVIPIDALIRIGCVVGILTATHSRLAITAALFVPPILIIHLLLFRRLRPLWRNIQDDRSIISARMTDMFGGIRVVRSFRRERSENKNFSAAQHTMIRKQQYTAILNRALGTGWSVFVPAIGIVIIWYGGSLVLNNELKIGDLVMYQSYIFMLLGPITRVIESLQGLQSNLASMDRMLEVINHPIDMPDKPNALEPTNATGHIEIRDVYFGYTPDKNVINGVTLSIPAGETVAIVGPSGSGKTTLVNLVARFFDVSAGAILLDGVDIRDIQRDGYRSLFAMVLQDVYLFDGTVADNIAYGRRRAGREEIINAAKQANAHEFIMEMEKGYDTPIGERGIKLSGGQKQRISIARAILADPRILILDEATSSLDSASESLIQNSLRNLMDNRTTLVIAHRLSTIVHADTIVVVVDGQIMEQGTHEELLSRRGIYHGMFTQQFNRHRDPELERIEWEPVPERQAS
jgi:ATP-binding cassette subfamily B protein/subfamily B ATP-binding cassette protein MsbA